MALNSAEKNKPNNPYSSHSNTNNLNYSQMPPYQPPNVIYNITSNHNSTMRPSVTHHNSTMRPSITHHNIVRSEKFAACI